MKITNAEVFNLLDLCSAVIIDGTTVTFPSLDHEEEHGDLDSIFLRLSYSLDDGDYDLEYSKKDNQDVEVVNHNTVVLVNTDGGETELTLLTTMNIIAQLE